MLSAWCVRNGNPVTATTLLWIFDVNDFFFSMLTSVNIKPPIVNRHAKKEERQQQKEMILKQRTAKESNLRYCKTSNHVVNLSFHWLFIFPSKVGTSLSFSLCFWLVQVSGCARCECSWTSNGTRLPAVVYCWPTISMAATQTSHVIESNPSLSCSGSERSVCKDRTISWPH